MCDSVLSELIDLKIGNAIRMLALAEHSHESAEHSHEHTHDFSAHEHPALEAAIEEAEEAAEEAEEAAEEAEEAAEEAEEEAEEVAADDPPGDVPPAGMGEESDAEPELTPNHEHPLFRRLG